MRSLLRLFPVAFCSHVWVGFGCGSIAGCKGQPNRCRWTWPHVPPSSSVAWELWLRETFTGPRVRPSPFSLSYEWCDTTALLMDACWKERPIFVAAGYIETASCLSSTTCTEPLLCSRGRSGRMWHPRASSIPQAVAGDVPCSRLGFATAAARRCPEKHC